MIPRNSGKTLLMAALTASLLAGCSINTPAKGSKVGQIVKVSKEGIICPTWEVELVRGGFSADGGGVNGREFHATVESDSIAKILESAMDAQQEVILTYTTEGVVSPCRSENRGVFVTSVKVKEPATAQADSVTP